MWVRWTRTTARHQVKVFHDVCNLLSSLKHFNAEPDQFYVYQWIWMFLTKIAWCWWWRPFTTALISRTLRPPKSRCQNLNQIQMQFNSSQIIIIIEQQNAVWTAKHAFNCSSVHFPINALFRQTVVGQMLNILKIIGQNWSMFAVSADIYFVVLKLSIRFNSQVLLWIFRFPCCRLFMFELIHTERYDPLCPKWNLCVQPEWLMANSEGMCWWVLFVKIFARIP